MMRTLAPLLALLAGPFVLGDDKADDRAASDFFASSNVVQIDLRLETAAMDGLLRQPRTYVPCALTADGQATAGPVALKLKGRESGSFEPITRKPALTVNMSKLTAKQRFHGLTKWHLSNGKEDPSCLEELVAGEVFRAAGVPAARIRLALVSINGKAKGLYYIKEGYDEGFLRRNFGTTNGNLYDGGFCDDITKPLSRLSGDGPGDHVDLKALAEACREKDEGKRWRRLGEVLDVDGFISFLCATVVTWNSDGYAMNSNNYRLYNDPKRNRLVFFPSGMDQMFGEPDGPLVPEWKGAVARAVMSTTEGRRRYLARMKVVLTSFDPKQLTKRIDAVTGAVREADPNLGHELEPRAKKLKEAVTARAESLVKQLKRVEKDGG
jgi:spore coat protein H